MSEAPAHAGVTAKGILRILEDDAEGAAAELEQEAKALDTKADALRRDAGRLRAAREAAFPTHLQIVRDTPDYEEVTG